MEQNTNEYNGKEKGRGRGNKETQFVPRKTRPSTTYAKPIHHHVTARPIIPQHLA
jgi:hypothetical protein